ncbi:hypothetical protein DITRI_Ditri01bG0023300 [Diplodiscus trichospermus]
MSMPWMLIGDFNAVLFSHERSSGSLGQGNKDSNFSTFVNSAGLVDIGFSGLCYTWCRGLTTDTFRGARLDRVLCNLDWNGIFPLAHVTHLPKAQSDHCPFFGDKRISNEQKPFRFQVACSGRGLGYGAAPFLGERNTRYFHTAATLRGKRKQINCLLADNDQWVYDAGELQRMAVNYYRQLYTEDGTNMETETSNGFPTLNPTAMELVIRPILLDDVKKALFDMAPYKAPGVDGFPAFFFQKGYQKSQIVFSSNVDSSLAQNMSAVAGIPMAQEPGYYLGTPMLSGRVTKTTFHQLLDKMKTKLSGWKARTLSMAGRITLVKHVLNTMPFYVMQTARLPATFCDELDRVCRNFVWGHDEGVKKIHLLDWGTLTRPMDCGGLGIRPFRLGRSGLNIFTHGDSASNIWQGLVDAVPLLAGGLRKAVENRATTSFWCDPWLLSTPLIDVATSDISLKEQNYIVSHYWGANGWDLERLQQILPADIILQLNATLLRDDHEAEDKFMWGLNSSGHFSVKSAYMSLRQNFGEVCDDLWRQIWRIKAPQRVHVFIWLALHGRLMTNEERVKRSLTSNSYCSLCNQHPELVLHALRDCTAASSLWMSILGINGRNAIYSLSLKDWFAKNFNGSVHDVLQEGWDARFALTIWWIWKWRCN